MNAAHITPDSTHQRQHCLIRIISNGEHSIDDLLQHHAITCKERCLRADLKELIQQFPAQLLITTHTRIKYYHWHGSTPKHLPHALHWISGDEHTALIAARELLSLQPQHSDSQGYFADIITQLLSRLSLNGDSTDIAPRAIAISTFGAASEDPTSFAHILNACINRSYLHCTYTNLKNEQKNIHCAPKRLINVRGEWTCIANHNNTLKRYRLSRISNTTSTPEAPKNYRHTSESDLNHHLSEAFYATTSTTRQRIHLAVSPEALPHLINRTWGSNQTWDSTPKNLPPGTPTDWQRLSFTTTGIAEAQHWILGFGNTLIAEHPPQLTQWIRQQAQDLLNHTAE